MKLEIQSQFLSSHDKRFGDLLSSVIKSKRLRFVSNAAVSVLIASACSGGEMKKQEEEFPRILPLSGEVFLTQGAHANDDSPTGIKSSIDFAPKEVRNCPPGARVTVDQPAVATTSGTITIVGNERDRNDPNHSIVEIKEDGTGLRFGTMHLDDIDKNIQVGEKVNKGDVIGKPSCEVPKGGQTTGVHLHLYAKDGNGNFVPINGQEISGWKIEGDKMTKKGEKERTADVRRCSTDTACGGIKNDLLNNPSKAVLGAATGPARPGPINAAVGEKPAGAETPKPTPRPTEKPTPVKEQPGTTMEGQAKAANLNLMLQFLSSTQKNKLTFSSEEQELTSTIVNPINSFPMNEIINSKQVPPDKDLLLVQWKYSGPGMFSGWKDSRVGEAEIKNFKFRMIVPMPVGDADKANGIQWRGSVSLEFIARYHMAWVSQTKSENINAPFSQWQTGNFGLNLILRNGRWEIPDKGSYILYPLPYRCNSEGPSRPHGC